MRLKRPVVVIGIGAALVALCVVLVQALRFPPDTTPEGAYMRIASAIGRGEPVGCFAYLEEDAQHAAFTIADYARKIDVQVRQAYPASEHDKALAPYATWANAGDGPALWVVLARERGYVGRLRRDLSGARSVEVAGDRATIVTARGTRYSFRRRPNGIWGLTIFTADMVAEAEKLARDWSVIQAAAKDYETARSRDVPIRAQPAP